MYVGNGTVPERLMTMIWLQKIVRLISQIVTRFSRHVWIPQKFALKLRDVQKKLRDVQRKLRAVENDQNRPGQLQLVLTSRTSAFTAHRVYSLFFVLSFFIFSLFSILYRCSFFGLDT